MRKKYIITLSILSIMLILLIITSVVLADMIKADTPKGGLIVVSEINFNTVTAMSVSDGENEISLYLANGKWYAEGANEEIDQIKASGISTHLCYVYADQIINNPEQDLSVYGLNPALVTATLTTKSGQTHTYYYGVSTINKTAVFMKKAGDDNVYIVINEHFLGLVSSITDLKDLSVPKLGALSQIRFSGKHGEITLTRTDKSADIYPTDWIIQSPFVAPVLSYAVSTMEQTIANLRLDSYLGEENKPEYGLENSTKWFTSTDENGKTLTLILGNDKDDYFTYCTVSGKTGYYTVGKQRFQFVDFAVSEFIGAYMLNPTQNIIGVSADDGTVAFALVQDGNTYAFNNQTIDADAFNTILDLIKDIPIGGVVEGAIANTPTYTLQLRVDALPNTGELSFYLYNKSFYAIDYGDGAHVYIPASDFDALFLTLTGQVQP